MYLAVKYYMDLTEEELKSFERGDTMPGLWPAIVLELQDSDSMPDGYTKTTRVDYDAYRVKYQSLYDAAVA